MAKQSFILVSLKDEKTKKLSLSISNDTCRTILNHLSEKEDATESDISKSLNIPISTVHYNLKLLVESGLVEINEFHYSTRGREVDHYSLANKMIVIAPRNGENFMSKLKGLIPAIAGIAVVGFVLNILSKQNVIEAAPAVETAVLRVAEEPMLMEKAADSIVAADSLAASAPSVAQQIPFLNSTSFWWFLIGGFAAVIFLVLWWLLKTRK